MDLPTAAALLAALAGAVSGVGGLIIAARRDSLAAKSTARDTAKKAVDAGLSALEAALDRQAGELRELRAEIESLENLTAHLRREVERCHRERDEGKREARQTIVDLTAKIRGLETIRDRALRRIAELETKVAELEARP